MEEEPNMTQEIEKIWPEWKVVERIGSGAYGSVYKAVRSDHNLTSSAAIKVISIPKDASEMESLRSDGMTQDGTRTYLQGIVDDFVNEIQLMETLKGIQNIVSVEDYKVVERTGEIGWDIYIRMELLTPFNDWKGTRTLSEAEVIRLGIDICSALEICEKKQIIHRDIKPENIFINEFGFFKLGDFGIARKLSGTRGGQSIKGTYNYMAPEVASGTNYDGRVDIYSLGIVLYRLLGVVASITLIGQVAGMLAAVSGWFGFMSSTTLTIPGIAGIILSVGMGVDANIITGERIREELRKGKTLDTALYSGYHRAFSAIFDGNLTGILVSIVLMGAFGVPSSIWAKIFNHTIFWFFGATTEGVIYSFGFTLMTGLIMNFIMGVFAARLMTMSLSRFKCFQNKKLYGGGIDVKAD